MARKKKPQLDDFPGLFDDVFEVSAAPGSPVAEPQKEVDPAAIPLEVKPDAPKLKFISFGSGSSGNCSYLGNDKYGILIDAGVDSDAVIAELTRNGISMTSIGGIILTHDHGDHIRYAYNFVRRFRHMRIYCTPRVLNGILRRHSVSRRIKEYHQPIFKEIPFNVSDFRITPFEVFHDGSDNVGFFIEYADHTFVVATDMGVVSPRADFYIRQAKHLMIEANYDLQMLMHGPYPEYLKARILSQNGHMDNVATAKYLAEISTPALRHIFLCHLSHDNNTPELAFNAVADALRRVKVKVGDFSGSVDTRNADLQLMTLPRFTSTGPIMLKV